jgi:hypothetical protein
MAESQVDGTCEAGACEDSISLIQQSSSVKRRTNEMETENQGAAPADVDLSPLAQAISAAVEQGVHHKDDAGSAGAPDDISVIVSLPTAYPPGSYAVGPTAPPVRGVSERQMQDYVDAHVSGGLTSAQIKNDVKMDVQKYIDEQLRGHLRISRAGGTEAAQAPLTKQEAHIYRTKPGEIIAKTTTLKPGAGGASGTGNGLNDGQTAAIQAQVQKETQAGIEKGIQAAVMDAQKAIEKQIAAGVQNGITQGIAAGLAGAGR